MSKSLLRLATSSATLGLLLDVLSQEDERIATLDNIFIIEPSDYPMTGLGVMPCLKVINSDDYRGAKHHRRTDPFRDGGERAYKNGVPPKSFLKGTNQWKWSD